MLCQLLMSGQIQCNRKQGLHVNTTPPTQCHSAPPPQTQTAKWCSMERADPDLQLSAQPATRNRVLERGKGVYMPDCTSFDSSYTNKSSHCRKKMKWAFFLGLEVAIETTECRIASKKEDIFNHPAHKSKQKTVTWHGTSVVIKIAKVNEHCDWEGNNWDPLRKLFIFQVSISLIIRYAKPFSNTFIKMHIS